MARRKGTDAGGARLVALVACSSLTACGASPPVLVAAERVEPIRLAPVAPVTVEAHAPSCPPLDPDAIDLPADSPVVGVERGEALAPFYEALARLVRGRASDHVRIAVYGDSNLTMDYPTGALRRLLQRRFGDGGHGFVAAGQPWSHYQHRDVRHGVLSGFEAFAITTAPTGDGLYGLGGIAVESQWQGARTFVETAAPGAPVGQDASRFDVFYLVRAWGGFIDPVLDGEARARIDTRHGDGKLGVARIEASDGPHRLELVARGKGRTRLYGVAIERDTPGVVVDSFGIGALNTKTMAKNDPKLATEMLRARGYDLVVYMTGANDVFTLDAVPEATRALVARDRTALPGVPILFVTPSDRGAKKSFELTLRVVEQQHRLAAELGLPIWDQWRAMGGRDSMARFLREGLAARDAIHFNEAGGAVVAEAFEAALLAGLRAHLEAHPEAGCSPHREPSAAEEIYGE